MVPVACAILSLLQNASMKMGVDALARQLRSRVREEFFTPSAHLPGARERMKDISAATSRHTTRDSMVLGKPLSSVTGSILTNVPLQAEALGGETRFEHESRGVAAGFAPFEQVEGGVGATSGRGAFW